MSHHDKLTSLDPATLVGVAGGVTSTNSDSQLATALQSIQSSLANLGKTNTSGSSLQQMLPFLLMLRGGGGGGGCPCGCGMSRCGR